jgi:hypothetical protein
MDDQEYYILDDSLGRDSVIEPFISIIWSERYSAWGDFQLVVSSTSANRRLFTPGTRITRKGSFYVMTIDTVTDATAQDGTKTLTIVGKSLEALLNDRVAMAAFTATATTPYWIITGTPGNIARQIFNVVCVVAALDQNDTIPFYSFGTLLEPGSIPESTDIVSIAFPPDTAYNSIKKICDMYALGFRLVKDGDTGLVYYEVYTGNDLTSTQTSLPPVIFDPNLETLEDITTLTSTATVKTVAYVFAQNGTAVVYAPTADPTDSGSDRRVLLVNSTNTTAAGSTLTSALQQEGLVALAACRPVYQFDGTMPQSLPYVYGVDYGLGDLVEERTADGLGNQMIVTEQIFSSDNSGEKSYPTLTLVQTITPGTWLAWDASAVWNTVDPADYWGTI